MEEATVFTTGHFGWHDMNTNDLERTAAFYTALFGWEMGEPDPNGYRPLTDQGNPFGGFFPMTPEMNASPNWSGYLMVDDIADVLTRAKALGGVVPFDPMTIPDTGLLAILFDPPGAMVTIFQHTGEGGTTGSGGSGETVIWNELVTTDVAGSAEFYSSLLDWTFVPEVVATGGYALARLHGVPVAGLFDAGVRPSPSAWLAYFRTPDIAASVEKASALGGTVIHPATEITGLGITTAWLNDPLGATFGLMQAEPDWFDRLRMNG
jgi:predicted enzyme related to lactoylglutathione lyase